MTKILETSGRIHVPILPGKPRGNGFIERSNWTDKAEVFRRLPFGNSEEHRDPLKLWEMEENPNCPHQGLGNQIPLAVYRRAYSFPAASR